MKKNKKDGLSILRQGRASYPQSPDDARLEVFDNPAPGNNYTVELETEEFTALCPVTSQPDYGRITLTYLPDRKCIESKSFKLYLFSYRNYRGFAEKVVNRILDDIVSACKPVRAHVTGFFMPRGGISITVEADYKNNKARRK